MLLIELSAEREGFEPPVPLGTVVFKTTVIDHSTISPEARLSQKRLQRYEFFRKRANFSITFYKLFGISPNYL